MTIEETRAQAVSKLGELRKIQRPRYSARELHSRRPMLARVQRKEQRRYLGQVVAQRKKLTKDISDIDRYLQSVEDYNTYLASIPSEPIEEGAMSVQSVPSTTPTEPVVLPTPTIIFGSKPLLKKTRVQRYKRRSKY